MPAAINLPTTVPKSIVPACEPCAHSLTTAMAVASMLMLLMLFLLERWSVHRDRLELMNADDVLHRLPYFGTQRRRHMAEKFLVVAVGQPRQHRHQRAALLRQSYRVMAAVRLIDGALHQLLGLQAVDQFRYRALAHAQRLHQRTRGGDAQPLRLAQPHPFRHRHALRFHLQPEPVRHMPRHESQPIPKMRIEFTCLLFRSHQLLHIASMYAY